MEISPSSSLITALSDFSESRRAEGEETRRQDRIKEETQRTRESDASKERVQVSSERELQAARDAADQADRQAIFRREAPNAGTEERDQPPGQIIDIRV